MFASRLSRFIIAALCLFACGGASYGATPTAPARRPAHARDSFLYPPANSTPELVAAVRRDRALRLRYARHFHVSEDQFLNFAQRALIAYRLPAARSVTTYGVTPSGRIYPVRERLPAGTRVWATHSGVPILKWRCANPLTTRLPGLQFARGPRSSRPAPARRSTVAEAGGTETSPTLPTLLTTASADALPAVGVVDAAGPLLAMPPAASAVAPLLPLAGGGSAAAAVFTSAAGGGGGFPWFTLPLFGLLSPRRGGGGNGSGPVFGTVPPEFFGTSTIVDTAAPAPGSGGPTPPGGGLPTAVVPEAGTALLLLAAAPFAGAVTVARRRPTKK
jgi:hypothetical protein